MRPETDSIASTAQSETKPTEAVKASQLLRGGISSGVMFRLEALTHLRGFSLPISPLPLSSIGACASQLTFLYSTGVDRSLMKLRIVGCKRSLVPRRTDTEETRERAVAPAHGRGARCSPYIPHPCGTVAIRCGRKKRERGRVHVDCCQ